MNEQLQQEIAKVLEGLKQSGRLREDLDVLAAAKVLNEYSYLQLFRMVSAEHPNRDLHRKKMREMTELMLRGMEKH